MLKSFRCFLTSNNGSGLNYFFLLQASIWWFWPRKDSLSIGLWHRSVWIPGIILQRCLRSHKKTLQVWIWFNMTTKAKTSQCIVISFSVIFHHLRTGSRWLLFMFVFCFLSPRGKPSERLVSQTNGAKAIQKHKWEHEFISSNKNSEHCL